MTDPDESPAKPTHAAHVTPWVSRKGGGVAAAMWGYLSQAAAGGWRGTVVGLRDADLAADVPAHALGTVIAGRLAGPQSLAYSRGFAKLLRTVDDVDLIHVHGLRHWPGYAAGREARRRGLPLVVSPHGGLYPQLLAAGRARKWLSAPLDWANLRRASLIHATSAQEARHVRAYGVRAPIAVVGLGIDAAVYSPAGDKADARRALSARWPELSGKRLLLYLGFLHAKKGLERLAQVLGEMKARVADWRLVIAGPDAGPDGARVRAALAHHGVPNMTTLTGPVWDLPTKLALLRAADLLAMPSDWENFGIAIGEALACETPVIASTTAPWRAVAERGCGWWIDVGVAPLAGALAEALAKSPADLAAMGRRGRALIVEQYDWADQARRLGAAYRWARDRGDRPAFVYEPGATIPEH